jgi:hypothetical protein
LGCQLLARTPFVWADVDGADERRWPFLRRILHNDLSRFHLLQYRHVDGFLITAKNSGTHWLRFMLSQALAAQHGLPPPRCASGPQSDDYIGHPRHQPVHRQIPRLASSHHIPSRVMGWTWLRRLVRLPPTVVLVRDIPSALVSHYVKWREDYGVSFSDYLRGDPGGRRFHADAWWYVHFFNVWGDMARRFPGEVLIVRYEDLERHPQRELRRVAAHWDLTLGDDAIALGVRAAAREQMLQKLDPAGEKIIPSALERDQVRIGRRERATISQIVGGHLRHDLGYGYL